MSPAEYLLVGYDQEQGRLVVDCRSAGGALNSFPAVFSPKENIDLQLFIDGTLVEVFADGRLCLSARYILNRAARLDELTTGDMQGQMWDLEKIVPK